MQALRQDVNDDLVVDRFVAVFLELLDERLLSIWRLLRARRFEDSVTALLSIETSSLMVGANDLAASAGSLRRVVGADDDRRIPLLYDELLAAGERAKTMLSRPYDA